MLTSVYTKTLFYFAALTALVFLFLLSPVNAVESYSSDADIVYAYMPSAVLLYKKTGGAGEEKYEPFVTLPPTYFIALLEEPSNEEFIHVSYSDITGYVKKADIEITDYEPVTKYAVAYFDTDFDRQNVNLRSYPDHRDADNILDQIPDSRRVQYYGTIEGTAIFPQVGNTWFYVKYGDKFGYVNIAQGAAQKIEQNVIEKVVKPGPQEPEITNPSPEFSSVSTTIFIICLSVPAVFIMLVLFRKTPQKRKPRHFQEE